MTGQWLGCKEHVTQKIQVQSTLESVIYPFPMPIYSWCPYINTFLVLCFLFFFMILFILDTFSCIVVHQHYFVFLHICTHICTLLCTYMCLCVCMHAIHMLVPKEQTRVSGFPGDGVTRSYEHFSVVAEIQTWVLCKSSKCS